MALIYNITIEPAGKEKENQFHITWQKKGTNQKNSFNQEAGDITREEVERLWQQPKYQMAVGKKLFNFLDGNNGYLQKALEEAMRKGDPLQLNLCPCNQVADWPFELLARDGAFLLPQQVHLVRCVSEYGTEKEITPQNRPLRLLFMACSGLALASFAQQWYGFGCHCEKRSATVANTQANGPYVFEKQPGTGTG